MSKAKLEQFIQEAISNIRDDRAVTSKLLLELMKHMSVQGDHTHETMGMIASKYVETLQRSNEQLVKISSIIQKDDKSVMAGLSPEDKEDIFDMINQGEKGNPDEEE